VIGILSALGKIHGAFQYLRLKKPFYSVYINLDFKNRGEPLPHDPPEEFARAHSLG
jgi:hypothetical protein